MLGFALKWRLENPVIMGVSTNCRYVGTFCPLETQDYAWEIKRGDAISIDQCRQGADPNGIRYDILSAEPEARALQPSAGTLIIPRRRVLIDLR